MATRVARVMTTAIQSGIESGMRTGTPMPDRTTRERILDAALDLFGARGVDAVSLDEIARHVGVRKQTVLYWFDSKEVLVDAVLEKVAAELVVMHEPVDNIEAKAIDAEIQPETDDVIHRCTQFRIAPVYVRLLRGE